MLSSAEQSLDPTPPEYLYKILSVEDWNQSQNKDSVTLSADTDFIHLATEEQLSRIIKKYWDNVPEFVVLKIDTTELSGELEQESNSGGTNKYYHLYNGSIPLRSVIQSEICNASHNFPQKMLSSSVEGVITEVSIWENNCGYPGYWFVVSGNWRLVFCASECWITTWEKDYHKVIADRWTIGDHVRITYAGLFWEATNIERNSTVTVSGSSRPWVED